MTKHYSIASYDKYLSLRVSGGMWLIFFFLLRPYIIGLMSVVNRNDRMQLIDMIYSSHLSMSLSALAGIPVILLIYGWSRRSPGASPFVQWIWRKGRILLAVSAAFNAVTVFIPLWLGAVNNISVYGWGQLFICVVILLTVYFDRYIRDCFADFPTDKAD